MTVDGRRFSGSMRARRQRGGSLAELGPVLWIFMIFFVLPFLDLISFGMGVSSVMLVSNWGARQAGPCNTFTDANNSILQTEAGLAGFRAFSKMAPTGGGNSGVSIVCQVTKMDGTSTPQTFTYAQRANIPNSPPDDASNPVNPPLNTGNAIYQYVVTGDYNVSPLFNFNGAPVLSGIPGLGAPVPVKYSSTATVEHPDGLQN